MTTTTHKYLSNPINKKRKITDDTKSIKQASQADKKETTFADILESLQDEAEKSALYRVCRIN